MRRRSRWFLAACAALAAAAPAVAQSAAPPAPRAWLGVTLADPERSPDADPDATVQAGALVTGVVKGSPADEAGLRASDLIVQVGPDRVGSPSDLIALVAGRDPGTWIDLEIVRNGERRRLTARLAARPELLRRLEIKRGWIGLTPLDVPVQLREYWGGSEEAGVLAGEVVPGGPADIGGIEPGDLILSVAGHPVGSARELIARLRRGGIGNKIEIELSRQGVAMTVEVRIEEAPDDAPRRRTPP
ncbi:MAG: PDZ domain-containing protein [Acidobacteria bacterium]|nr:MAG: PDZ domain-containing protein [Acidobacteriota bacterium]